MDIRFSEKHLGAIRKDVSLKKYGTWHIGGACDLLLEPKNAQQIQNACQYVKEQKIPCSIIGGGANLLFDDEGIRGALIRIGRKFSSLNIEGVSVLAEVGIRSANLTHTLEKKGLAGLEFLEGIPGTLGGMIFMNAGANGYTIGERIRQVWALDPDGQMIRLSHDECKFGYRHSVFQEKPLVIMHAELECRKSTTAKIHERARDALKLRYEKFPLEFPSCGSVFEALPRHLEELGTPGEMIEAAGLKGLRIGDAEVSTKHANFIVNVGKASAGDIIKLADEVRKRVHDATGHILTCEVRYVTNKARIMPLHKMLSPIQG